MSEAVHELGWLKRRDLPGGTSELIGGFGEVVAIVPTPQLTALSADGQRLRCRWHFARP